ncbi:MAG: DUF768 domain-containing protein [Mesorhizobium sp.]|nr:MAG: DUF768 domain-containing protein [Mesorhizobium sp.]
MEPARPPQTSGFLHATDFEEGPEGSGQIFLSMSARALKFLDRWMAEHLPNVSTETQGPLPILSSNSWLLPGVRASRPKRYTRSSIACFTF